MSTHSTRRMAVALGALGLLAEPLSKVATIVEARQRIRDRERHRNHVRGVSVLVVDADALGDDADGDGERRRAAVRDARLEGVVRSPWRRRSFYGGVGRRSSEFGWGVHSRYRRTGRRTVWSWHRERPLTAHSACSCSRRATRTSSTNAISEGRFPRSGRRRVTSPSCLFIPLAQSLVGEAYLGDGCLLVVGSWVRVAFGTMIAVGKPPEGLEETFVWITDSAVHRAR